MRRLSYTIYSCTIKDLKSIIQAQVRVRSLGNWRRQIGLQGLELPRRMSLWAGNYGGADIQKLNEVLRKDQVKRPVQGHADFLFEPWELEKVNRSPEPPGDKSREVNAQDVGYTGPPADRCKLCDCRKIERFFSVPRMDAIILRAAILPCRSACCAVGG